MSYELLFVKDVKEILVRDLNALKDEIKDTPDELLWLIVPGIINPIGTLAYHICGNLRHFIGASLGNDTYVRHREDEFKNHTLSTNELLQHIDATIDSVNNALESITVERLTQLMPDPPPQHQGKTVGFFLVQLCCHLSRHRGQLNYIRRILEAR